jgi:hypothetical protein
MPAFCVLASLIDSTVYAFVFAFLIASAARWLAPSVLR